MKYLNLYADFLKKQADVKKSLKVVLDCSNGPAGLVLKNLKIHNSKFIVLNSRVDGRFPAHGPNPLEARALENAAREVKKQRADLGVVFDADGDRAIFVDDLGRRMPFHAATLLLSLESDPPHVGDIYVAETMKQLGFSETIASKVGAYYVKKVMKKTGASFGSELSGHYYFAEMKNADSGILAAIKALNVLSKIPYTSSQFSDMIPAFYSEQFNVRSKNTAALMKKMIGLYRRRARRINHLDGFILEFDDWFMNVRPSNTELLLRFFVGAKDKKTFSKEVNKLKILLR